MFTIDLLKGKGLPKEIKPKELVFVLLPLFVLVICLMLLITSYMHNSTILAEREKELQDLNERMKKLSNDSDSYLQVNKKIGLAKNCLTEIAQAVDQCVQWTPILQVLADKMPDRILLKEMDVKRVSMVEKVPDKENPRKKVDSEYVKRSLRISVCGPINGNSDSYVQNYVNTLKASPFLTEVFEDVKIVARQEEEFDKQQVVCYELDCPFKVRKAIQ